MYLKKINISKKFQLALRTNWNPVLNMEYIYKSESYNSSFDNSVYLFLDGANFLKVLSGGVVGAFSISESESGP